MKAWRSIGLSVAAFSEKYTLPSFTIFEPVGHPIETCSASINLPRCFTTLGAERRIQTKANPDSDSRVRPNGLQPLHPWGLALKIYSLLHLVHQSGRMPSCGAGRPLKSGGHTASWEDNTVIPV